MADIEMTTTEDDIAVVTINRPGLGLTAEVIASLESAGVIATRPRGL